MFCDKSCNFNVLWFADCYPVLCVFNSSTNTTLFCQPSTQEKTQQWLKKRTQRSAGKKKVQLLLCIDYKHVVNIGQRPFRATECSISLFLLLLGQVTMAFILFISKRPDIDYFTRKNDKWQEGMTRSAGSIREMIVLLVVC